MDSCSVHYFRDKLSSPQVLIVQASAFTKYMGNLSVYFDYKGDYVRWDGGPIYLDRSIHEGRYGRCCSAYTRALNSVMLRVTTTNVYTD